MTCPREAKQPQFEEVTRSWGSGWRRYFFPGFWLVYLGQTLPGVEKHSSGIGAFVGYALVVLFAATYLAALPMGWMGGGRLFWWLYGVGVGLTVAECFFAGDDALTFCVYLAVLTVASRLRGALLIVAALVAAVALAPRFVPSWGSSVDWNGALTVGLVAFA